MRSVAVIILIIILRGPAVRNLRCASGHKICSIYDAAPKIRMRIINPGIDHRDRHVLATIAERIPNVVDIHLFDTVDIGRFHDRVRRDRDDRRMRFESGNLVFRNTHGKAIEGLFKSVLNRGLEFGWNLNLACFRHVDLDCSRSSLHLSFLRMNHLRSMLKKETLLDPHGVLALLLLQSLGLKLTCIFEALMPQRCGDRGRF